MNSANGLGKSANPPNFTSLRAPSHISSKISRCCPNTKAKPTQISSFPGTSSQNCSAKSTDFRRPYAFFCIMSWEESKSFSVPAAKRSNSTESSTQSPMKPGIMSMRLATKAISSVPTRNGRASASPEVSFLMKKLRKE